jgi:serine/threonine protein kinase
MKEGGSLNLWTGSKSALMLEEQFWKFIRAVSYFTSLSPCLATNYSSDIIHGDIKPQNVLVFENGSEGYTAKVADFGYSTLYVNQGELIAMPRHKPWTAPEWHHRGFRIMEAMKMDAYSFGMLVMWLLFYNQDLDRNFENDLDAKQDVLIDAITKTLSEPGLDEKQRKDLACFFNATLVSDTARRCSDFKHLLFLLASYE